MVHIGVLGEQLSHSLSPVINQYLLREEQIQGSYHVMEIEEQNVTIPYKEAMMEFVDEISPPRQDRSAL